MPTTDEYWALPDGISEALPAEAWRLESLRRDLLDLYATWGYQLVMPPLVEYMQSLSTGLGSNLDVQTFKVTDQLTGRMMGIRADMTPQIARIDAHKLKTDHPNRLCYLGSVLHTRAFHGDGSRSPLQVGAELFGHAGLDSDLEVISLLLATLARCEISEVMLDIGHVGIFRGLVAQAGLSTAHEQDFFDMLERKSLPEIDAWLANSDLSADMRQMLQQLPRLYGSLDVLERAARVLAKASPAVQEALAYLRQLAMQLQTTFPACQLHIDLTELSGYNYHTGIVYAAYSHGNGREIARGGRYDGIGELFGRARPATGFSADLRVLTRHLQATPSSASDRIWAPAGHDPVLVQQVADLRTAGRCVIRGLEGDNLSSALTAGCNRQLVQTGNQWIVRDL